MPRAASVEFGSGVGAVAKEWVLKPNQTRINLVIKEASKHLDEPRSFDAEMGGNSNRLAETAMVWMVIAIAIAASAYAIYSVCVFIEEYTNCFSRCALRLLKPKLRLSSSTDCPSDCNKRAQKKRMASFQQKDSDADVEEAGYDPRYDNSATAAEDGDEEEDEVRVEAVEAVEAARGVVEVLEMEESGTCAADAPSARETTEAKGAAAGSTGAESGKSSKSCTAASKSAKEGKRPSVVRFASNR
jgi:hypothetical protein